MKSKVIIPILIAILAIVAYYIGTSFTGQDAASTAVVTTETESVVSQKPDRKPEVYGKVIKMEGNVVTISEIDLSADPTAEMTTEEKQAYKQSLTEEERMALKEATQNAILGETTVLIPVGVPMTKKTAQGAEAPEVEGTLADVAVGSLLSVWTDAVVTDRQVAEFVKISSVVN